MENIFFHFVGIIITTGRCRAISVASVAGMQQRGRGCFNWMYFGVYGVLCAMYNEIFLIASQALAGDKSPAMETKHRKQPILKGAKRQAVLDVIRCSFSCPASASLQEKFSLIDEYWDQHPEYGLRIIADGTGVSPQALSYHRRTRSREHTQNERHRIELEQAIIDMSGDWEDGTRPSTCTITDELRFRGFVCGRNLISKLLIDLGFDKDDDL